MKYLPFSIILLGGALPGMADYVVDSDLGILASGDTPLIGTTAGGNNNSVFPKGLFAQGPNLNWGTEFVYQFEILQPTVLSLTSNSIGGDPDFFLLTGLATSIDLQSGKISADNGIDAALLDFAPPETNTFNAVMPGIYYLAVESYIGPDGGVVQADASFDVALNVAPASALDFPLDLFHVAREGTPISFDTFGSGYNTELAIYDIFGALIEENDDAAGGEQSEIVFPSGLPAGSYYAVIAGSDTTFDPNFLLSTGGAVGDWTLNFPLGPTFGPGLELGTTDASFPATEAQFFFFSIAPVPFEPIDLGTLAGADEALVINTTGSLFDTQLGLFDSEGFLMEFNDDIDFDAGNYLSELDLSLGLPEGTYFLALAGYPNFYADGFFVTVDTRVAPSSEGGDYTLNSPGGMMPGTLTVSGQQWFTFSIGSAGPTGIRITDVDYDKASNEFTVTWDSSLGGPFNIFIGTAGEVSALGAPPANVLPTLGVASVTSPATFTVPLPLQGEPALFLQVTD